MIASVVPITRLRRDTTWWSYKIPAHLKCSIGSLVVIPFRGRPCLGIIWDIADEDSQATVSITEVLSTKPLLKKPHREVVQYISQKGLCSLSTALYVWLPNGLRDLPLTNTCRIHLKNYQDTQKSTTQHCIVLPSLRPHFQARIRQKFPDSSLDLFNQTPKNELDNWFSIATGLTSIGYGREHALFAPWSNLTRITVLDPEDISYYREQLPYLSLLTIAQALASECRSELLYRTHVPTIPARLLWGDSAEEHPELPPQKVTDLRRMPLINPDLVEKVSRVLVRKKSVLILYNAHDRTHLIQREGTGERILIPGIETLRKKLTLALGLEELPKEIIFGTRSDIAEKQLNIGLTIILSLDPLLSQSSCFANLIHGVSDIAKLIEYDAPCIIQSTQLEHPLVIALTQGTLSTHVKECILQQKDAQLPPFGQTLVASLPGSESLDIVKKVYDEISQKTNDDWNVSYPFSAPWRKKPYQHILIHAHGDTSHIPIELRTYLVQLPRPWKVQINPWYLL